MKTIFVPVESNSLMGSVLETAWQLGSHFGSRIDGIALKPSIVDFIAPDPVVVVLPQPHYNEADAAQAARQSFDEFVERRSAQPEGGGGHPPRLVWSGQAPIDDAGVGSMSRVYDITVVGRPGVGRAEPRMTTLEAALFEGGRPVLMAPPRPPRTIATNILVHWNASTETARVVLDALPMLKLAHQVTLLTVEGNMSPGPRPADMIAYLDAHGIKATEATVRGNNRPGEAILAEARRIGCDLLVKGAYTQSRLRQMIFGGATNHILQAAEIPVILSH